jgi:hypothetical protein
MHVPEAFEVCASCFLCGCERYRHQRNQHDIAAPTWASRKICQDKAHETQVIGGREASEIVPMRNGVDPGEEDDRPCDEFMECDVLVERNDVVERRTTRHGD